jgi:hypothetical protein
MEYTIHVLYRVARTVPADAPAEQTVRGGLGAAAVLIRHRNGGGSLYLLSGLGSTRFRPYFYPWEWWARADHPGGPDAPTPEMWPLGGRGGCGSDAPTLAAAVLEAVEGAPLSPRLDSHEMSRRARALLPGYAPEPGRPQGERRG